MSLPVTTAGPERRGWKSKRDRLAEGEQMLRDRALGMLASDLCSKYDVSKATLYRRLDEAVKARLAPTVDAYREQQNALLDDLMQRWEQQANAADVMIERGCEGEGNMSLVERGMQRRGEALAAMLRVSERRAKLNGLDAPVRGDLTVTITTPIDAAVAALVAEVEEVAS